MNDTQKFLYTSFTPFILVTGDFNPQFIEWMTINLLTKSKFRQAILEK